MNKLMEVDFIEQTSSYLPNIQNEKVKDALVFATKCHLGQKRKTGEPYIIHPIQSAKLLADMNMDWQTIAAALLHDVMEDCGVSFMELENKFGVEVATLVDGVTKLPSVNLNQDKDNNDSSSVIARAATVRKLLLATSEDARVMLIKLSDRLHNMQTLHALNEDDQSRIALETMEIFAPLAHRLGMWEFKWKLEDESFKYLLPNSYKEIARLVSVSYTHLTLPTNREV